MRADLATIGTSTANPGSFYGRVGLGPDAAVEAADAVLSAVCAFYRATGELAADKNALADCLDPTARIRATARHLNTCLKTEAEMAALALSPHLDVPEPDAAAAARAQLRNAARHADTAAGQALTAWRTLDRELRREPAGEPDPRADRPGRAAADQAANLEDKLAAASQRHVPASLPMITGHAAITAALTLTLSKLQLTAGRIAAILYADAGDRRQARRAAVTIEQAGTELARALVHAGNAQAVLDRARETIRKAPPGYPCANCAGTGTSRLSGGTCDRCRGGGTDPYALRR